MIRILILLLILPGLPAFAKEKPVGSIFVELLEYQFAGDLALLDAEAEYGTSTNWAVLKVVATSDRLNTQAAVALLYRRAINDRFYFQAGVEFSDEARNFILGIQGKALRHVDAELLTIFDENGAGYLSAKLAHDWSMTERLILEPKLEVFGAFQRDGANGADAGLSTTLAEVRLRYELHPHFMPYVGLSWERALGDSAKLLSAAGEKRSLTTALAGVSFLF